MHFSRKVYQPMFTQQIVLIPATAMYEETPKQHSCVATQRGRTNAEWRDYSTAPFIFLDYWSIGAFIKYPHWRILWWCIRFLSASTSEYDAAVCSRISILSISFAWSSGYCCSSLPNPDIAYTYSHRYHYRWWMTIMWQFIEQRRGKGKEDLPNANRWIPITSSSWFLPLLYIVKLRGECSNVAGGYYAATARSLR